MAGVVGGCCVVALVALSVPWWRDELGPVDAISAAEASGVRAWALLLALFCVALPQGLRLSRLALHSKPWQMALRTGVIVASVGLVFTTWATIGGLGRQRTMAMGGWLMAGVAWRRCWWPFSFTRRRTTGRWSRCSTHRRRSTYG